MLSPMMMRKAAERIEELSNENEELKLQHQEMQKYVEVLQYELECEQKKRVSSAHFWN